MRVDPNVTDLVAVVTKHNMMLYNVVKRDKRGKVTLEDGSEWNVRNGRRWGNSNPSRYAFSFSAPQMVSKDEGIRIAAYRAEQKAKEEKHVKYREGVARITKALQTYYANDMEAVKEKIAEARAELDKLEKEFA